jgi:hypothetical protein
MKENVKIDGDLLTKVRKESKKRAQTIGGFIELATKQSITPQYFVRDNCDAFHKFLDDNKIKWKGAEHFTIVMDVHDPVDLGVRFGIYKAQNDPAYKK